MSSQFKAPASWRTAASVIPALVLAAAVAGTHIEAATTTAALKNAALTERVQIRHAPLILSGLSAAAFGDWEVDG